MPHPTNPFPILLDFALLAPFLLRVIVGLIYIDLGYLKLRRENERWETLMKTFLGLGGFAVTLVAFVEMLLGLLLILGLYTQVAALVLALLAFANAYLESKNDAFVKRDIVFHVMLFTMAVSLLFLGAGFLAFDLPL